MIEVTATPDRIIVGQAKAVTFTTYSAGTATDLGTITIGIVDANGDTVVSSGTAVTDNGNGTYSYTITAPADVNVYYVTLTEAGGDAFTLPIEVVGAVLFTENDARTFGAKANGTAPLATAAEYSDAMLNRARDQITDELEAWTGRSWVPRYCRRVLAGRGTEELWLADGDPRTSAGEPLHRPGSITDVRKIIAVTVGGTAITAANVHIDKTTGRLWRTDGVFSSYTSSSPYNVVVEYVYGLDPWVDAARRIGLLLAVDRLVPSAISDRATSFTDELGTLRFETPGRFGNVSTLPEVNHWVKAHSMRVPIV